LRTGRKRTVSEKEVLELTEGSKYSVITEKGPDSEGTFKGYMMLGDEPAIVLEMGKGKLRMIPVSKIVIIDLLVTARGKKDEKKSELYYG